MSPKTTRTRKSDLEAIRQQEAFEQAKSASRAVSEAPDEPVVRDAAPRPSIDTDDLAAIASMSMDDLAALMDGESLVAGPKVGDKVTGPITRIGRDNAFIEIGAKSEGQIAVEELEGADIGAMVTAYVLSTGEMGIHLSKRLAGAAADLAIDEAFAQGTPVEGYVASHNKGGFDVRIGSVRAFCPISQMDRVFVADAASYVGQSFSFRVLENDDKIVLSRRAILEEGLEERVADFWLTVAEGQTHQGSVSSVVDFGIFVDLGGVDGLVPKRELSWEPGASFKRGDAIEVRVIGVDRDERRLTLSAKDPGESPWNQHVGSRFIEGGTYPGTVTGVEPFGAFVELAPGLQGLLHKSRSGGAMPAIGDGIDVTVAEIDHSRQRLALASTDFTPSEGTVQTDEPVEGTVREVLQNGVLVDLKDGRTGWLPAREVDLPAGTVLAQRFRRGRAVSARVQSVDPKRDRVTLTQKTADAGSTNWRAQQQKQKGAQSFGTFGDLLKGWNE